jgi:hypothetical protein
MEIKLYLLINVKVAVVIIIVMNNLKFLIFNYYIISVNKIYKL